MKLESSGNKNHTRVRRMLTRIQCDQRNYRFRFSGCDLEKKAKLKAIQLNPVKQSKLGQAIAT